MGLFDSLVEQQETDFPVLPGTQHHRQSAIVPIFPPIPIVDDPSHPWFFVGNTRHLTEVSDFRGSPPESAS